MLAAPAAAAELILYSSPNFEGEALRVTGDVPNLREFRFNDEASSIVVLSVSYLLLPFTTTLFTFTAVAVVMGVGNGDNGFKNFLPLYSDFKNQIKHKETCSNSLQYI